MLISPDDNGDNSSPKPYFAAMAFHFSVKFETWFISNLFFVAWKVPTAARLFSVPVLKQKQQTSLLKSWFEVSLLLVDWDGLDNWSLVQLTTFDLLSLFRPLQFFFSIIVITLYDISPAFWLVYSLKYHNFLQVCLNRMTVHRFFEIKRLWPSLVDLHLSSFFRFWHMKQKFQLIASLSILPCLNH